jgi:bacteriocin biosynthesis cyclodehydratase domain-containing protein
VRVKLRDDLMSVRTDDGVFLETGVGSTRLTGAAAHGLIQRLAPHLDGGVTLETLTAHLPAAQRALLTDMATMLVQRGIARDLDAEPAHRLQDWELDRFRQAIAFVEHVTSTAPLHHFETFRNGRVLLVGGGDGMLTVVSTLLELGLRSATVLRTPEARTDDEAYRRIIDRHRHEDPSGELRMLDDAVAVDDRNLLAGYDAVLHCADRPMPARALALTRAARAAGVPVLHAFPTDDKAAWIGPSTGGDGGGCWECAALGRDGARPPEQSAIADDQPDLVPQWFSAPVGSLVGAALAFAYLQCSVGERAGRVTTMVRVDLRTAVTSVHRVAVHPRCGSCRAPAPEGPAQPIDLEMFGARMPSLVDHVLGPLLSIGVAEYSQMLVSCVEARMVDLSGAAGGPVVVSAVGASRDQALVRAAVAAVERMVGDAGTGGSPWSCAATGEAVTDAVTAPTHLGAGLTWAEAQGRALLKLHRAVAVAPARATGPSDGDPPGEWLEEAGWPQPAQELAGEVAVLGHHLRAWRDDSAIPTVFVGADSGWLAHTCAPDPDVALEYAVQAAVAHLTDRPRDGAEIGPDLGAADWGSLLPALSRESTAGSRALLRRVDVLPAIREVVPFVAEAAVLSNPGGAA